MENQETRYQIRPERPEDHRTTENLTREAFWNVYRPGCTEHYILHTFREREEFVPELDLVMEKEGRIIGHIMYARAVLEADDGRKLAVMTFGPVSIAPDQQRKGYGKALVEESLRRAAALGAGAVCIEGNPDFYGTCGFVNANQRGIYEKGGSRDTVSPYFLVKELREGYLDGVRGNYCTPEGYFADEEKVEQFDREFPPKVKEKRPGQLV